MIYVNDILIISQDLNQILEIKRDLMNKFDIKDLGEINRNLINFIQISGKITMSQKAYIEKLLNRFGM